MLSMMDTKRFFSPVDKHAQFCYWAPALSVVNPVPQRCLRPGATCGRPVFLSAMTSGQKYLKKAPKPLGPFEGHRHPATVMLPQEEEGAAGWHFVQHTALLSPSEQPIHEAAGEPAGAWLPFPAWDPIFLSGPFTGKNRREKKGGGHIPEGDTEISTNAPKARGGSWPVLIVYKYFSGYYWGSSEHPQGLPRHPPKTPM